MSQLYVAPSSASFGDVTVGGFVDIELSLSTDGLVNISSALVSSSSGYFSLVSLSSVQVLFDSPATAVVRFSPSGAGAEVGAFDISSDATNNPVNIPLSGTGVVAGTKSLSVDPSGWTFPNTKVGVTSTEKVFTITNTGTVTVQVTALTFSVAPFTIGATSPGLPANILAGNTLDFGADFTPAAEGYLTGTVSVVSDAAANPFVVNLAGTGFLITPAYTLLTSALLHLLAFATNAQVVAVKKLTSPLTYNTEEACTLRKWVMLPFPTEQGAIPGFSYEKQVMRVFLHYENWGQVTVVVTLTSMRGQVSTQSQVLGTVGGTGQLAVGVFDLVVVDEVVEFKLTKAANAGPLVIVDYTLKYEVKGERAK